MTKSTQKPPVAPGSATARKPHTRGQYPASTDRRRRLEAATGYCWATLRGVATAVGLRACDLTDERLIELAAAHKSVEAPVAARGRPRGPQTGTRRSPAQVERLEASTGYAWHTIYRVARSRGHRLARLTDAEITAMMRWHTARHSHGATSTRDTSSLRRVCCDYCGQAGAWRYDYDDDAIVCARGEGCSKRRPEDERLVRGQRGAMTIEYRARSGWWYSARQIAALAEITQAAAYQRMRAGWTVEDAIRPVIHQHNRPHYFSRLRRALDEAQSA